MFFSLFLSIDVLSAWVMEDIRLAASSHTGDHLDHSIMSQIYKSFE